MTRTRYEIGERAWRATFESSESFVICPDCGGSGRIRCLLHDDTMVSVDCEGCKRGYNPPTGRIHVYDRAPRAVLATITGMEITEGKVEYHTADSYRVAESEFFDSESAAMVAAVKIALQADRDERDRIAQKEKPTKTWSWHVHYHRRAIREAQKQIEYHTGKLNVASLKAKEPTP